jgi:rSAM/selenodomain-associated transferase 2
MRNGLLNVKGAGGTLVSVVIPTLNEAATIAAAVASARSTYGADEVEVIVADGGSTDRTQDLVPDDVVVLSCTRGRAAQMNAGAAVARGRVVLFLHADTLLPSGWREAVIRALERPGIAGGCFRPLFAPAPGLLRVVNAAARLPYFQAAPLLVFGDQALFTHRATFERVGGFAVQPLMEDVELVNALSREGRLVRLPLFVTTSSRRFLARGPVRQQLLNARLVLSYRYLGATATEVAQTYEGFGSQR